MAFGRILMSMCLVGLASCSRHDSPPASNAGTLTPAAAPRSATESIAQSRCQREQRCNNVGADRKYSSQQDCLTRIRNDWKDDLGARECARGINQSELDECLMKIREEDCNSPFDSLERVTQCTKAQICLD